MWSEGSGGVGGLGETREPRKWCYVAYTEFYMPLGDDGSKNGLVRRVQVEFFSKQRIDSELLLRRFLVGPIGDLRNIPYDGKDPDGVYYYCGICPRNNLDKNLIGLIRKCVAEYESTE